VFVKLFDAILHGSESAAARALGRDPELLASVRIGQFGVGVSALARVERKCYVVALFVVKERQTKGLQPYS